MFVGGDDCCYVWFWVVGLGVYGYVVGGDDLFWF